LPKILLVDDEPSIQKLLKASLAAMGYQVLVASNGEEALELARLECPDLVLLDLKIPRISGWDVLAGIKANEKLHQTAVIIMTGAANPSDEDKARRMGAVGCLAKPFTPDELTHEINLVLGKPG
jgi:DNA-binding response OmpR family regulator